MGGTREKEKNCEEKTPRKLDIIQIDTSFDVCGRFDATFTIMLMGTVDGNAHKRFIQNGSIELQV